MFKMWRLHTLLSYVRGGIRSNGWRVCEPHSKLVQDDREHESTEPPPPQQQQQQQQQQQEGAAGVPRVVCRRPRLLSPQSPVRALSGHVHTVTRTAVSDSGCGAGSLPSAASLWYLSVSLQPADSTTPPAAADLSSQSPSGAGERADSEQDGNASEPEDTPPDQPQSFESVRLAFVAETDRLMAELQNAAGAGVAAQRPDQALECFRRAAARGSAAGWYNSGVCFQRGVGTRPDTHRAAVCYEEAVWLGHAAAAYNLALLRAAAVPVTSLARGEVTRLLQQAAAGGSVEAAAYLPQWTAWSDAMDSDDGDLVTPDSPLSRSVSLPALSDSDYDSGPGEWDSFCCGRPQAGTSPVLYLNEAP